MEVLYGSRSISKFVQDNYYHSEIRKWAHEHGAKPATVKGTGSKVDPGVLRLDFPDYSGAESLEHISWDKFFEKFDQQELALLYQTETEAGRKSNFNKLIHRGENSGHSGEKKHSAHHGRDNK